MNFVFVFVTILVGAVRQTAIFLGKNADMPPILTILAQFRDKYSFLKRGKCSFVLQRMVIASTVVCIHWFCFWCHHMTEWFRGLSITNIVCVCVCEGRNICPRDVVYISVTINDHLAFSSRNEAESEGSFDPSVRPSASLSVRMPQLGVTNISIASVHRLNRPSICVINLNFYKYCF